MLALTHDKVYFDRMANSLGDKIKIVENLNPGTVLDVGAGGGNLSDKLYVLGYDVTAIDGSAAAIKNIHENFPHIKTQTRYVSELPEHFEENSFDNIVCSSIMHEVYSYSENHYKMDSVFEAFEIFFKLLKPGGRLIIRDGVKPNNHSDTVMFELTADYAEEFMEYYKAHSGFYSKYKSPDDNSVSFFKLADCMYSSDMGSAMEVLYTYTWGMDSAEREVQELYGIFTQAEYVSAVESAGFMNIHQEQYLQDGYKTHLQAKLMDDEGYEIELPSSNMILIFEK